MVETRGEKAAKRGQLTWFESWISWLWMPISGGERGESVPSHFCLGATQRLSWDWPLWERGCWPRWAFNVTSRAFLTWLWPMNMSQMEVKAPNIHWLQWTYRPTSSWLYFNFINESPHLKASQTVARSVKMQPFCTFSSHYGDVTHSLKCQFYDEDQRLIISLDYQLGRGQCAWHLAGRVQCHCGIYGSTR